MEIKRKNKERIEYVERTKAHSQRRAIFLAILLIVGLGFSIYANSLNGKFLWDDDVLVRDNVYIRNWSNSSKIFIKDIGIGGGRLYHFYRPMQTLSYMIDYSFWKLDVRGYHFTNILLHILVALAIYWLTNILFADDILSLLASLLFVTHPIHTEAVSYISGRADSLVGIFILLAIIFYIKYLRSEKITMFIFSWLSFMFAILSKEYGLILPLLLGIYHIVFKVKFKTKQFLLILSATIPYIFLRFIAYNSLLTPPVYFQTTIFQRVIGFFAAFTDYLKLLILPFNLHMEYGYKLFNIFNPKVIFGVGLLALLLRWAFKIRNKNKLIFFSITWFFITLIPQSNLYPVNAYMAEHWLYLPSIGFFLILGHELSYLYRAKQKGSAIPLLLSLTFFYSFLTIRQNNYWKEPIAFYKRTLEYAPHSWRVLSNLGKAYQLIDKDKHKEEIIGLYERAIENNPNYVEAYNNLCFLYYELGENDKAISSCKKAIEINPNYAKAYNNLASAYKEINKLEDAVTCYKKAIELNPEYANAYNNLGLVLYTDYKRKEEGMDLFKKAVAIDPDFADAHNNLAVAYYYYKKQYGLAIKHCDKAIELGYKVHPDFLKLLEPFRK